MLCQNGWYNPKVGLSMKHRTLKNDDEAVSPVIAVILMVAITVVLAAVVYAWLQSFLVGEVKNAPAGSASASRDGSVWVIDIIKVNPSVSVESIHWYLLDPQGNPKIDGLVSAVYGVKAGNGEAVGYTDVDADARVSPGDKFEIYPGEANSDLSAITDITGYTFRMKYVPTGDMFGYDLELI